MPPVFGAIGAVVGAIGSAVGAIGGALGLAGAAGAAGVIGGGLGIAGAMGGLLTVVALTAGLKLIGKLLRGSTDPPPARGSVTDVSLDPNSPQPYAMGEGLIGGVARDDQGYGATLNDVPNPYRWIPVVHSGGGPVESFTPWADQAAIDTGYYGGFMAVDTQLGACPESTALVPPLSAPAPDWDSASKLSGLAASGWNYKFDRDGKVFASGLPQIGAYGKWVKVYDPRLDSTFPGGSGAHRLGVESTYEWSENPALHAGTYAHGRWQNGMRTMGVGLPAEAIQWEVIAAWANVCDANNWRLFGVVTEGQAEDQAIRWANLKDIAMAGGGQPLIAGGVLSFLYQAPRVSIETITEADIAGDDILVTPMRSYRDRLNTIVPTYISPDHNWQAVPAEPVSVSTYVTDDGEVKQVQWPFNLVKDVDQVAQLARYMIEDGREIQPIEITCMPHMRALRPGEAVDLYLPSAGLDTQAVILHREIDPASLKVKFILIGETPAKHAYALTTIGGPPPAPGLALTGEERDEITWGGTRGVRPTEPVGGVSGGVTGGDVADTVLPGGGVAPDMVDTAAILDNSVSAATTLTSGASTGGNGSYQTIVSGSVTLTEAGRLYVHCCAKQSYSASPPQTWNMRIKIDGSVVGAPAGGSGGYTDAPSIAQSELVTAGPHTIDVEWQGTGNLTLSNDTTFVMGLMK